MDKSESERSEKDIRYCNFCQPIIEQEYAITAQHQCRKTKYKPVKKDEVYETIGAEEKTIMSTLKPKSSTVDIINPPTPIRPIGKRGPKHKELPEDLIKQMADDGMGSKAIATRLSVQSDVDVSYKTVQRVLSGERG